MPSPQFVMTGGGSLRRILMHGRSQCQKASLSFAASFVTHGRLHQGFVGGSLGEGVDNINVLAVGQPVALSQKAWDIVPRGLV